MTRAILEAGELRIHGVGYLDLYRHEIHEKVFDHLSS
jgi:hypothetical protein